ncbi:MULTISPECIES: DUF3325 family protein [Sphingobium]|uniref:DUF3325 family protein n=1 Tax=Sphingobium sp. MI1205 TaxID=407020 RepID=UPI0007700671|nr:DUF3325 family protein [Sphingobium sp. MI1205]AMK20103.1 hypothetical protein K663_18711 [Sphingobium sp. MI1205]
MTSALFISLAIASSAFSLMRLSLGNGTRDTIGIKLPGSVRSRRWTAVCLLTLSAMMWSLGAAAIPIGLVTWLFSVSALAALPLILLWPYRPRSAIIMPPIAFAIAGLLF